MEEKLNYNDDFTIAQASRFLDLSTKTIHNYIKKKILKASKWNGMWLIENGSIMEVNMKLNRSKIEFQDTRKPSKGPHETSFWVDKAHYEELLRQAGQLRAAENLLVEYKSQNQRLLDRIKDLEKEIHRRTSEAQKRGFWRRLKKGAKMTDQENEKRPS